MKKKIQTLKENKGFSMIELIIVIAIMAILVGIIGSALIPYMEKSRASKDKSLLDGVYNAYASCISESEDPSTINTASTELLTLLDVSTIGDLQKKLKSKQFKSQTIQLLYDPATGYYGVYLQGNSGYYGVKIDNTGTEYKVGVKGTPTQCITSTGATGALTDKSAPTSSGSGSGS